MPILEIENQHENHCLYNEKDAEENYAYNRAVETDQLRYNKRSRYKRSRAIY